MIHNTSLMIFHLRIENKNKILEGIFKKKIISQKTLKESKKLSLQNIHLYFIIIVNEICI